MNAAAETLVPEPGLPPKANGRSRALHGGRTFWNATSSILALQKQLPPLRLMEAEGAHPLSYAQERLWQLEAAEPGAPYYHVILAWDIRGELNVAALERSLDFLAQRHEVLRASFPDTGKGPVQLIGRRRLVLSLANACGADAAPRAEALRQARHFVRQPFDLACGPLLRAGLWRYGELDYLLVFAVHQMLFDGASMRIFSCELGQSYRAFVHGTEPQLEPAQVRYSDFAEWQRQCLRGEALGSATRFWQGELGRQYEPLRLTTDHPRRNAGVTPGAQADIRLPAPLVNRLKELGREHGITPFTTLLASLQAFLGRMAGQEDVLTLATIAGRNLSELTKLIGLVANVVPLRLAVPARSSFREILLQAGNLVSSALAHQMLPLSRILEMLPPGSAQRNDPVLQILLLYNNTPLPVLRLPRVVFTPALDLDNGTAKFDLSFDLVDSPQGIVGQLKYREDLFERATMRNLLADWQHFIEAAVVSPDEPLRSLPHFDHRNGRRNGCPVSEPDVAVNGTRISSPASLDIVSGRASTPSDSANRPLVGPRNELEEKMVHIWENVFALRPIGIHDNFFSLGGHSLTAVRLIALIEKETGRRLRLSSIFEEPTIARLAQTVPETAASPRSSIVEMQPLGNRPPLFLVHGVGGGMFWGYNNLARALGPDQPVYAFKSRGLDGFPEFERIEDMAAQYVADLRRFRPQGPYYLGGYCFGGNVAYEMARQLTAQGQSVAMLLLINCWPNNSSYMRISWTPAFFARALWNFCLRLLHQIRCGAQHPRNYFEWRTAWVGKRIKAFFSSQAENRLLVEDIVDLSSQSEQERRLWRTHVQAWLRYQPQPYAGRVFLFRTRGHPLVCSFDHQMGWGSFAAGGVVVKICRGDHESILEEENVGHAALHLKAILDEAQMQHALSRKAA